jgi:hypothetical protein
LDKNKFCQDFINFYLAVHKKGDHMNRLTNGILPRDGKNSPFWWKKNDLMSITVIDIDWQMKPTTIKSWLNMVSFACVQAHGH